MRRGRRDDDLRMVDDGDSYVIFQCQRGCSPTALLAGLYEAHGMLAVDPSVVDLQGAPAVRARFLFVREEGWEKLRGPGASPW
jgi:hypothetical protein